MTSNNLFPPKPCQAILINTTVTKRMKPEHTREVLEEYDFSKVKMINPNNKTYDWDPVRYNDLKSMIIRTICDQSCALLGTQDLLMKNPEILVERHHVEIKKDSSTVGRFGIHTDDDGPAGGPCPKYFVLLSY